MLTNGNERHGRQEKQQASHKRGLRRIGEKKSFLGICLSAGSFATQIPDGENRGRKE